MHREPSNDKNKNCIGALNPDFTREVTRKKKSSVVRRGPTRHRGLLKHAKMLGVHRNHLYQCLTGARVSHSLMERYRALLAKEHKA